MLAVCEAGHWREEDHAMAARSLWHSAVRTVLQAAVERLLISIIKLQRAGPRFVFMNALGRERDINFSGTLFPVFSTGILRVQICPKKPRTGNGNRIQISAIDRDTRSLACGAVIPLFTPPPPAEIPERHGLQGGSLAGIVGADKHDGIAEVNFGVFKPLEVGNRKACDHVWSWRPVFLKQYRY